PTASGRRPLVGLSIPGDFIDPLGLATLVEPQKVPGRGVFLEQLGASHLTLEAYVCQQLPTAIQETPLPLGRRRAVLEFLCGKLSEFRRFPSSSALRDCALVECEDG